MSGRKLYREQACTWVGNDRPGNCSRCVVVSSFVSTCSDGQRIQGIPIPGVLRYTHPRCNDGETRVHGNIIFFWGG